MTHELEQVRAELKRFGYLDHGLERLLLQDALRPRRLAATLAELLWKVALAGGTAVALAAALLLAALNTSAHAVGPLLTETPLDVLPLLLHLLPPAAVTVAVLFLLLAAILTLTLRRWHVDREERLCLALAVFGAAGVGVAVVVLGLASGFVGGGSAGGGSAGSGSAGLVTSVQALLGLGGGSLTILVLTLPPLLYLLLDLVYTGLLALAIKLTDEAPRHRQRTGAWIAAAVLLGLGLLVLPAWLTARPHVQTSTANRAWPAAPGQRVLLLGVDGVLAGEFDYLLQRGELPTLQSWLDGSQSSDKHGSEAGLGSYPHRQQEPAVFWTSVATGLPASDHGVAALDSFRPLGVSTPLANNGPLRLWWSVERSLGLVEHRPILANRRRAFAAWELVARGGRPVLAVNWWSTYPAEPLPGLVVAHGAYQLLQQDATAGALASSAPEPIEAAQALHAEIEAESLGRLDLPGLTKEAGRDLYAHAVRPDDYYLAVFEQALSLQPRVAALYLPGLDIVAAEWRARGQGQGSLAYGDLVRRTLTRVDALLAEQAESFDTVVLVLDPGRRKGREGRVVVRRRGEACEGGAVNPEAVASAVVRASGLPQSRELPEPPSLCPWAAAPDVLETFGQREGDAGRRAEDQEYLENLRSLGYL